jgi:hypothetical protein
MRSCLTVPQQAALPSALQGARLFEEVRLCSIKAAYGF